MFTIKHWSFTLFILLSHWLALFTTTTQCHPFPPPMLVPTQVPIVMPDPKHFREAETFDREQQYDVRFYKTLLPNRHPLKMDQMRLLIHGWLNMTNTLNIETWIAHGTLLGWFWNARMLPWDHDLDVQVSWDTLQHLALHHNTTTFTYHDPHHGNKEYLLDVNRFISKRYQGDQKNVIDARWIDKDNGLFIDITAIVPRDSRNPNWLFCKNNHMYTMEEIYPLRDTIFEGAKGKVPNMYTQSLRNEYGTWSMKGTNFERHHFDENEHMWLEDKSDSS